MKETKNLKTLNFKIDNELLERVNYYRAEDANGAMSQADFVNKALEEKCDRTKTLRSGGMLLKIPNPNNFVATDEQKIEIILKLSTCANTLMQINPGLSFGVDEILSYAKQLLITLPAEKRKEFELNFYKDLDFENKGE